MGTGRKKEPRGNREVLKVGESGVRGYIDEGGEIKVENCRRKCGENGGKMRETDWRVHRRYHKEDIDVDIGTNTEVETAETEGNGIGDKNRATEEGIDCEIDG